MPTPNDVPGHDLLEELRGEGPVAALQSSPDAAEIVTTTPTVTGEKTTPIPAGTKFPPVPSNARGASDPVKDLDVTPLKKTPVQSADSKHAIKVGGKGYRAVVTGEYYAPSTVGRGKVTKPYELEFIVPQADGCLGLIVGKLLVAALQKRVDPTAVSARTHHLKSVTPIGNSPVPQNLALMGLEQLVDYISANSVPIDAKAYGDDVVTLRESVIDHKLNASEEEGLALFIARETQRAKEIVEKRELLALNDLEAAATT